MTYRVIEDWHATYANPIRLAAGDPVHLTGRQDEWDGDVWLWARSEAGLEGWIPDSIVVQRDGEAFATEAFTAAELTCRTGQTLDGEKETHGWVYCRSADGRSGWVPRRNLSPVASERLDPAAHRGLPHGPRHR